MQQYDTWEEFYKVYRHKEVETETDLYYQVGKTINKKPIDKEIFDLINENITKDLQLSNTDILVELCCGNGLCTYEFKDQVQQIIATDFAAHLIEAANKFKLAPNISYTLGSALDFLNEFKSKWDVVPNKYLMNHSIPHFTPTDLADILKAIVNISGTEFTFLITGAPDVDRLGNFYNTEERWQKYKDNIASGNFINDGMGRWWTAAEFEEVSAELGLACKVYAQDPRESNYRLDILISGK
jgi:hypothetical protein